MVKTKTLREQKTSSKREITSTNKAITFKENGSLEYLLDEDNVALALLQCFQEGDAEGLMEIIEIYLKALNKAKSLKKVEATKKTAIKAIVKAIHSIELAELKIA